MRRLLLSLFLLLVSTLSVATPAQAAFGLRELDTTFVPQIDSEALEAGSHPESFTTTLGLNTKIVPDAYENPETHTLEDGEAPEGDLRNLSVSQMSGLVGSQTAVPRCSEADFRTRVEGYPQCPDSTAVGIAAVKAEFTIFPFGLNEYLHVPVYNLAPSPGEAAKLGFVALNVPIVLDVGVLPKPPYDLVAHLNDVPQALLIYGSQLTIWGVPAAEEHDALRGHCVGAPVKQTPEAISLGKCPANTPEVPFLTLPRACQGPLATVFEATSWQGAAAEPEQVLTHDDASPPATAGIEGCQSLGFSPDAEVEPTSHSASSPSGVGVTLTIDDPGLTEPHGRAQSDIRAVQLTLPEGMSVNAGAADGMEACSKAQYEAASPGDPGCPEAAKLGTVSVHSPLLEEGLRGSIYLARPDDLSTAQPGAENPFDTLIAFYLEIEDARNGIFIKQAGRVAPDPLTGRLTSVVEEIPQLPFSDLTVHFREGPRAPLTTPLACGTYQATATFDPYAHPGTPTVRNAPFTIASGPEGGACVNSESQLPDPPSFEAGTQTPVAGLFSPFVLKLSRNEASRRFQAVNVTLPPGLTGRLAGIAECSDAQIALAESRSREGEGALERSDPSCSAGSEIGVANVGAGSGAPLYVQGRAYLAGPYKGAPLSMVIITPAVAGPFDLGTVVVRSALYVNESSAQIAVKSDPIPSILHGIPIDVRSIAVQIARKDFTLNPTNCEAMAVGGEAIPFSGQVARLQNRFQVEGCEGLSFKPNLKLFFSGKTKRAGFPGVKAVLTQPKGENANIAGTTVVLPKGVLIANAHVNTPCTRVQFNSTPVRGAGCPPESVLGTAKVWTPLLEQPEEGKVYFRSNGGERQLPDMVVALRGKVPLQLVGFIDSVGSKHAEVRRIRSRFFNLPDAPVSRFELRLFGGKKSLLVNSRNLCKAADRASFDLTGQNGAAHDTKPRVQLSCGKSRKRR